MSEDEESREQLVYIFILIKFSKTPGQLDVNVREYENAKKLIEIGKLAYSHVLIPPPQAIYIP